MRRCSSCFRFHPGHPTFCSFCGRSFGVRICSRGHINPRSAQFCSDCGSGDLSTPATEPSLTFRLSGLALYLLAAFTGVAIAMTAGLALIHLVDWQMLTSHLAALILMLGFLYWATTLLPGPVKKLGKAVVNLAGHSTRKRKKKSH